MCGIAGYVDFRGQALSEVVLESMANALRRRGPDGSGVFVDGPCGLAHRRLSIIDLEGSPQPMTAADGGASVSFNGEIYNYRELRQQLTADGVSLRTQGDTEVVLELVSRDGAAAIPKLDGMYAFAVWHASKQRVLLARDPLGIKPLFFAMPEEGLLIFGSEIKALLEHPLCPVDLDEDGLRMALRFRATYGETTLYRGIRQLPPGGTLEFGRDGLRLGKHYDLVRRSADAGRQFAGRAAPQLISDGATALEAAVRKRLVADVPVGSFLSGGLDSSLIVSLMKELRAEGEELRTYSVGFRGDPRSELGFARTVADRLETEHTEVELSEDDYLAGLVPMTQCRDAPLSEPADVAIARMSEVAKRDVKVVLSGEGADELFCGYPKYWFSRAPWLARRAMRLVGEGPMRGLAGLLGVDTRRAAVVIRSLRQTTEVARLAQWFSYLDRALLRGLFPGLAWQEEAWAATTRPHTSVLEGLDSSDPTLRMQVVDCLTWLPSNLLERGDRMSMAASLELRVPFLDTGVVDYGLGVDRRLKMKGRTLKWVVREWARRRLPPEILERPKWGFRVPLAEWFRGLMKEMLYDYLTNPRGLCGRYGDPQVVAGLIDAHQSGRADENLSLWTLLSCEIWFQDCFLKQAGGRNGGRPG